MQNDACISFERVRECSCCKKEFLMYTNEWAWWYGPHIVCSYHCMRQMRKNDKKPSARPSEFMEKLKGSVDMSRDEAAQIIQMRNAGMTIGEISDATGFSVSAVKNADGVINRRKRTKECAHKVTSQEHQKMLELHGKGLGFTEIAGALKNKYSICTIRKHVMGTYGKTLIHGGNYDPRTDTEHDGAAGRTDRRGPRADGEADTADL